MGNQWHGDTACGYFEKCERLSRGDMDTEYIETTPTLF